MEVLIYILKSAAILSLFYLAYVIFLRKETFFKQNRCFLLGGILAAAVLPAVSYTRIIYKDMPVFDFEIPEGLPVQQQVAESFWSSLEFADIALFIYSLGSLLMLVLFGKKLYSILTFLKHNTHKTENGFRFIQVDGLEAPFSFFRYIVLDQKTHNDKELEMIVLHEQAHASQLHTLDMLLMQLVLVVNWFNPLAWFYKDAIIQNLEYLADFHTAGKLQNRKQYQLTLVQVAVPKQVPAFTHSFYQSFIKKRIVMLNKSSSKKINQLKMGLILPLLAVFMWSFNVSDEIRFIDSGSFKDPAILKTRSSDVVTDATVEKYADKIGPTGAQEIPLEEKLQQEDNQKTFKRVITSTSTEDELKALAEELKTDYNVILKYSNLKYNRDGLLTSIKLNVKDKTTGNQASSTYSSDKPLGDIVIYRTEEGTFGVVSGSNSIVQGIGRAKAQTKEAKNRAKEMEARMQERRAEIELRREEMQAEVEARKAEMEAEVELRKAEIEAEMELRKAELEAERELRAKEMQMKMEERRAEMEGLAITGYAQTKSSKNQNGRFKTPDSTYLNSKGIYLFGPPEKGLRFFVRGRNGETLEDQSLFIKDGEEISQEELRMLDPKEIESISILKDESATSLYGEKAKNGVILITTKVKKN